MNSLNIVSRLTTPPVTPPRSRTGSSENIATLLSSQNADVDRSLTPADMAMLSEKLGYSRNEDVKSDAAEEDARGMDNDVDEKTPLLDPDDFGARRESERSHGWHPSRRVTQAILYGVKVVFTTITAPARYVIACFYDQEGHFSAILPLRNLKNILSHRRRKSTAQAIGASSTSERPETDEKLRAQKNIPGRRSASVDSNTSTASGASSDGETGDSPARHTRSRTAATLESDDGTLSPHKRSIRIKVNTDESLRKRKAQKSKKPTSDDVAVVASALKSPSSPSGTMKMTRYPRTPAPPRPLVPRRQPSYTLSYSAETPKKTLIIDLDETLIHSMAKGGRMSTGHMVEVRLGGPVSSSGVQIGPGVPILYCVHERPGCHEFLRKISKWYNLVVFTASVQEYADPVIDWLERERRYFSGRYYRQHCTFRNGAYIKDLAQVEPDLSKVMILDNSPMSYIFHEGKDNHF